MNLKPLFSNKRIKRVEKCPRPSPPWRSFRPCDLFSDLLHGPWHLYWPTDYANEHLVTPISCWLDSLALQLAPSNHHRAAYLHLTRFRNSHIHTHTEKHALCRKSESGQNAYRVFIHTQTHTNSHVTCFLVHGRATEWPPLNLFETLG